MTRGHPWHHENPKIPIILILTLSPLGTSEYQRDCVSFPVLDCSTGISLFNPRT
jgi:hypothetical protein